MRLLVLLIFLGSFSASAQKSMLASKKYMVVGSGGGFSGNVKQYILLESGKLYLRELPKDTTYQIRSIRQATTKKYFDKLVKLNLPKRKFNHPGNMSYFIEDHFSAKKKYGVTWGSAIPPKDIQLFYDEFMKGLIAK